MEDPPLYQHRVTESVQTSGSGDDATLLGRAGLLQQSQPKTKVLKKSFRLLKQTFKPELKRTHNFNRGQ